MRHASDHKTACHPCSKELAWERSLSPGSSLPVFLRDLVLAFPPDQIVELVETEVVVISAKGRSPLPEGLVNAPQSMGCRKEAGQRVEDQMKSQLFIISSPRNTGVFPPSIMFATLGAGARRPISSSYSRDPGASTKLASAPSARASSTRAIASSSPHTCSASVRATMKKSRSPRASTAALIL